MLNASMWHNVLDLEVLLLHAAHHSTQQQASKCQQSLSVPYA